MAFWLATTREGQDSDWIQRFDPRFWTVNFPRPMMASVVTSAPDALRVDAVFLREGDLAGLIWDSVDSPDHPLLGYATDRDYSRTSLGFRWRSAGVVPLDAVNGPTLTIEGKDAGGNPRSWYVRLWNHATGAPDDAMISLAFSELSGGFLLPAEADPVHPAAIDRMFISLVAPAYVPGSTTPLAAPVEGWAELSEIRCEGQRAMLEIGDVVIPPHGLAMATAYDDSCNQTPARIVRSLLHLGYRGSVLHYVGMSHFFALTLIGSEFLVSGIGEPLCTPARAWHRAYFAECVSAGLAPIASISFELLAQHCKPSWQQRAWNGDAALTGWDPPSALLSPTRTTTMTWLRSVATAFAGLLREVGATVRVQIGEPWWWVTSDGRICLYDAASKIALGGNPVEIPDMRQPLDAAQTALLDQAGALLASATISLRDAIRAAAAPQLPEVLVLTFLPTVLDPAMPEARRANLPVGWAAPAFDRLQLEDYDWLTAGADAHRRQGYATVNQRLGYPAAAQDYLAGFASVPGQLAQWRRIDQGVDEARERSAHEIFVWALPQVSRDGFVRLPQPSESDDMQAFDDIPYPLALGRDATVTPEFSTSVALTASGYERRNSLWSDARLRFDVGPGIRSEAELGVLLAFFRARRGAARGFRMRDPSDFSSNAMVGVPTALDQLLGIGDGVQANFPLAKLYGVDDAVQLRRITRPRADSVLVSFDNAPVATGWTLGEGGTIDFSTPPGVGVAVRAGFLFDVPVRFAEDRLEISGAAFAAGEAPSVPIVELREAA